MKKTLLSILAIAGLATMASAQIEMYVNGGTTDYSDGGVYTLYATGETDHSTEIHVENHTGNTHDWLVSRTRINRPTSWVDYLCWGHESDQFGGVCIDAPTMDSDPWTITADITVADGEYGFISSHVTPSFNDPATVTYRYYVGTSGNPYQDSMDLVVILTPLELNETPLLEVSVAPNPATDYVKVTAEGVESATVKMIDVLGNVILKETIKGSKTIDVAEFRNGIYFVIIEAEGVKTINRKVIVRH
jgi:hypothetical protein